jgi:hypothetical protein
LKRHDRSISVMDVSVISQVRLVEYVINWVNITRFVRVALVALKVE